MKHLTEHPIYLASKSPRRSWLLEQADLKFEIINSDAEEVIPEGMPVLKVAEAIAIQKADGVLPSAYDNGILLTADTVVLNGKNILGKPKSQEEATKMLMSLSNTSHKVTTGVCMRSKNKSIQFTVISDVTIASLSVEEVEYYISKYKPFDKAGAYGIQEWFGWATISSIKGSYPNIMGLPIHEVYQNIKKWGAL